LDHTLAPPVDDDVRSLRAFMYARIGTLPDGGAGPDGESEVTPGERERLLVDFLDSPEGRRWRGDDDARDVVELAISSRTITTAVRCAGVRSWWRSS
jgi:hypothetical protein